MLEGGLRTQGIVKDGVAGRPLVSVVTVVRNGARHLEQTILSVLGQGYGLVEYIVVDGGSTDGTLEIIRRYADRIDYWCSEPDGGIYQAMNKGISLCRGALIGLKNADDFYTPDAVERVVAAWLVAGEPEAVYGDTLVIWREEPLETSLFCSDHELIGRSGGIDHRTLFLTEGAYQHYRYDTRYRISADYDLLLALRLGGGRFVHCGAAISYKRAGGASASPAIFAEVFDINRRRLGLLHACWVWVAGQGRRWVWHVGNGLLRTLLGPGGFARFKARRAGPAIGASVIGVASENV